MCNARHPDTFTIEAGALYRTCVPSRDTRAWYCVIVRERAAGARVVVPAGSEPNQTFAEGVQGRQASTDQPGVRGGRQPTRRI